MIKIILAQVDTIAGDIESNSKKIIKCILKAQNMNADLIIFPEFALTGYPFGDILFRHKSIWKKQIQALAEIEKKTQNITAIIGYADDCANSSTAIIQNSNTDYKSKIFSVKGEKYAVFTGNNIDYNLLIHKPDTLINCACSPSRQGAEYSKNTLFSSTAKKYGVNFIYVNKAGYADNFSFDGISRIYDKTGSITLRAKAFEEDFAISENLSGKINELPVGMSEKTDYDNFKLNYHNDLARTRDSIVFAIKQYFTKNGFKKAVLGLSGGLDSSVCAVLLSEALGTKNVWGISMPSKITSQESKSDAEILAKNLDINFLEIPLSSSIDTIKSMLNSSFDLIKEEHFVNPTTLENLQARIRATILWSISNEYKEMLPIATSDKSEGYIGYATVNGDMSGGFAPIADVTKTKLFALASFLNENGIIKNAIPQSVLEKPPGAELKINQETGKTVYAEEDNMPYEFLDEIIWLIENKNIGKNELLKHTFLYEKKNKITYTQKEEWINKFYYKSKCAVYKWHIMPPSVITDTQSINGIEYHQPIISII